MKILSARDPGLATPRAKYAGRIGNVVFLNRVGPSLRWATAGIPDEELPEEMRLLLRRLGRLETRAAMKGCRRTPPHCVGTLRDGHVR